MKQGTPFPFPSNHHKRPIQLEVEYFQTFPKWIQWTAVTSEQGRRSLRDKQTEKRKKRNFLDVFENMGMLCIPVVQDRYEVLHWKDKRWRGSGLNICGLCHPGSDQDRIRVLESIEYIIDSTKSTPTPFESKLKPYRLGPIGPFYDAWWEHYKYIWKKKKKKKFRQCTGFKKASADFVCAGT